MGTGAFARPGLGEARPSPRRTARTETEAAQTPPNPSNPTQKTQILFPSTLSLATLMPQRGLSMFRARKVVTILSLFTLSVICSAQQPNSSTATCNLDDGRQLRINYTPVSGKNERISNGKPWAPGGSPMTLFTEAPLSFGNATIPIGA